MDNQKYILPPVIKSKTLEFSHFPTRMQCFIYRNWEMIEVNVLAKVLETDTAKVLEIATEMGLQYPKVNKEWLTKGYITIIRANWHLLPYSQLCILLGWNEEKLAYILKEDDFLSHKLGAFKPDLPILKYSELTDDQRLRTKKIREYTLKAREKLKEVTVEPFDFKPMFSRISSIQSNNSTANRFKDRIVYSYCALYGDTLSSIVDIDESFPDELLSAYKVTGVNGIWMQAVMYTLVPFPFDTSVSEGYEERLKGLNYLINKLDKYGIKLYLYLNEPRSMPEEFFNQYPDLKGEEEYGFYAMCTSAPKVKEYIRKSSSFIAEQAPALGGFITITASENLTNCYSRTRPDKVTCPRCMNRTPAEVIAEVNRLIYEGVESVSKEMKVIAWSWGWNDNVKEIVSLLPPGVTIMGVSEQAVKKEIGGVTTSVLDYSISVVGPGDYAINTWKQAKESRQLAYAKVQANCTWECAAVPFIPAFELVYTHLRRLTECKFVDGLMLGWTLGGYPSATLMMLNSLFSSNIEISLEELYHEVFPEELVNIVKEASRLFSEAFDCFPFHIGTAYTAPQNYGPSNLLYENKTGFNASMVGYPYDDLDSWRSIYPRDIFVEQLKKMSELWYKGVRHLEELNDDVVKSNQILSDFVDCSKALYCHFRSMYLQSCFVINRENGSSNVSILEEEEELCINIANIMAHNPTIGYESSNHYFYNRASMLEKYVCCEYLKERDKVISR